MDKMRLQKYLAEAGIASRRKSEELIIQGKVSVNGNVVTELGTQVIPNVDIVKYEGKEVIIDNNFVYILLNKPALILTNDGDFVYKVTHPKHEIEKTYTVTIKGIVTNEEVSKLRKRSGNRRLYNKTCKS